MDRVISKKNYNTQNLIWVCVGVIILLGSIYWMRFDWSVKMLDKEKTRMALVRRADLTVDVIGSGHVVPNGVEWVVAKAAGVVAKVHVAAGDVVKDGQLLLELANPEFEAKVQQASAKWMEAKAALSSKKFELSSQEMQYRSAVVQAEFNFKTEQVFFESYKKLKQQPNSPVAELEYIKSHVAAKKQQRLYEVAVSQLDNFRNFKAAQLDEFQYKVDYAQHEHQDALSRVNQLKVFATKAGVLQDFDLKIGQPMTGGASVGKIVDPNDVFVRLEMPATDAYKMAKGQPAMIQIGHENVAGIVARLDPNIKGTTMDVDVKLVAEAKSLKVDMFVSGRIMVSEIKNTLVVARTSTAVENAVEKIYKLAADETSAHLMDVHVGALSASEMQILGGLSVGDTILVSDTSPFEGAKTLRIH